MRIPGAEHAGLRGELPRPEGRRPRSYNIYIYIHIYNIVMFILYYIILICTVIVVIVVLTLYCTVAVYYTVSI